MPVKERAHHIGYVPQLIKSDLNIKVMDYFLLGRVPYKRFRYTDEDIALPEAVMEEVGISEYAMRDIWHLSGNKIACFEPAKDVINAENIRNVYHVDTSVAAGKYIHLLG